MLDLLEQSPEHDENTQSRTDTLPSSKSNESCTTSTTQGTPTYSGPSNYYRLHTATISRTLQCFTHEFTVLLLSSSYSPTTSAITLRHTDYPPDFVDPDCATVADICSKLAQWSGFSQPRSYCLCYLCRLPTVTSLSTPYKYLFMFRTARSTPSQHRS